MPQTMVRQPESVTQSVVKQIASAEEVGAIDIPPLFESTDPDALETLFTDSASAEHITIEFDHCGYHVTIDGGRVSIEPNTDQC